MSVAVSMSAHGLEPKWLRTMFIPFDWKCITFLLSFLFLARNLINPRTQNPTNPQPQKHGPVAHDEIEIARIINKKLTKYNFLNACKF